MDSKDTEFSKNILHLKEKSIDLSTPIIMGILNLTPDSFFDGGKHNSENALLKQVEKMMLEGASIIDIGGYSSRPNAKHITTEEEINRIQTSFSIIKKAFPESILSIDTFRSQVAKIAIEEGASIVNDISAGNLDKDMFELVSKYQIPYILMHMKGTPQTMQQECDYDNLLTDIHTYFLKKIHQLHKLNHHNIILDLGFGFAKNIQQNYQLLKNLSYFDKINLPVLIGVSRKSMIYSQLNCTAKEALNGTTVLNTIALEKGAKILRVHDVKEAMEAIKLYKYTYDS